MAKAKADLFKEAQGRELVPADANVDDYTGEQLATMLAPDSPAAGWVASADKPIVAADGHVVLSQEDIDRRG